MTQKNFMSARALTMTELENVNGGIRVKTQGPHSSLMVSAGQKKSGPRGSLFFV